jgi:hypothetical protein
MERGGPACAVLAQADLAPSSQRELYRLEGHRGSGCPGLVSKDRSDADKVIFDLTSTPEFPVHANGVQPSGGIGPQRRSIVTEVADVTSRIDCLRNGVAQLPRRDVNEVEGTCVLVGQ